MKAEQITMANDDLITEITAVPKAFLGDEELPDTHMIPQVVTWPRSTRRIVNFVPPQSKGVKKPKQEEQQQRYIDPIPPYTRPPSCSGLI